MTGYLNGYLTLLEELNDCAIIGESSFKTPSVVNHGISSVNNNSHQSVFVC
jgi:hypothetical protein